MPAKLWNCRLWAGFGLSLGALAGYVVLVNETRAVFWPALLLFVVAAVLLFSGLKRRSREPELYRGKISAYVLTTLSVLIFGLFGFVVYQVSKVFPDAKNAPQIGQRAPEFFVGGRERQEFHPRPIAFHSDHEFRQRCPRDQRRACGLLSGLLVSGLRPRVTGDTAQPGSAAMICWFPMVARITAISQESPNSCLTPPAQYDGGILERRRQNDW